MLYPGPKLREQSAVQRAGQASEPVVQSVFPSEPVVQYMCSFPRLILYSSPCLQFSLSCAARLSSPRHAPGLPVSAPCTRSRAPSSWTCTSPCPLLIACQFQLFAACLSWLPMAVIEPTARSNVSLQAGIYTDSCSRVYEYVSFSLLWSLLRMPP